MVFLRKFGPKNQNCHFMLKFGTYTISSMQSSMMLFSFFVFEWKYSFWENLVQNIKIVTLCWNLLPRLIRIWGIQWCDSLFLFPSADGLSVQILSKKSKLSVEVKIWYLHKFEYGEFNDVILFFCFRVQMAFFCKFGQKSQNYQLKLKFGS